MNRPRKVKCIETGKIYDSITDAARACYITYTAITAACRGRRKTAAGFHWCYM